MTTRRTRHRLVPSPAAHSPLTAKQHRRRLPPAAVSVPALPLLIIASNPHRCHSVLSWPRCYRNIPPAAPTTTAVWTAALMLRRRVEKQRPVLRVYAKVILSTQSTTQRAPAGPARSAGLPLRRELASDERRET